MPSVTNLTNTTWNLDTTAFNSMLSDLNGSRNDFNLTFTHSGVEYIKFHYDDADWFGRVEFTKDDLSTYRLVDDLEWKSTNRIITIIGGSDVERSAALFLFNYYCEQILGFNVTYEENGGTTQTDLTGQTTLPDPLPTPTKSGYAFVNWYYDSAFTQIANAGDTIEEDTTLYAKWHNLGSLFTEIADAIRSKDGTSGTIRDVDFGERVKQIQGAIELTQAQYDALSTKDSNTYYLIVEVE